MHVSPLSLTLMVEKEHITSQHRQVTDIKKGLEGNAIISLPGQLPI